MALLITLVNIVILYQIITNQSNVSYVSFPLSAPLMLLIQRMLVGHCGSDKHHFGGLQRNPDVVAVADMDTVNDGKKEDGN